MLRKLQSANEGYNTIPNKFDHRYHGNLYYNFFAVFVGLFIAADMIMPDGWRNPAPLILAVFIPAAVARFSASSRNQN
jgi:hypothetical protein